MSATLPPPVRPFRLEDAAGTHKFTVDEYHRMLAVGVLVDGEPVELLDGYVVKKWDREAGRTAGEGFPQWSGLRKFTVAEYHAMIEAGILTPDDPAELLEGYVVNKMPQNTPHGGAITRLNVRLLRRLPAGWTVRIQLPVSLAVSEPEPDVAVVRGDETSYDSHHPGVSDCAILIGVADSSLVRDRRDKGRVYAAAGIPAFWVVNVADRQIEVYTDPDAATSPPAYRTRTDYRPGDAVPLVLDGRPAGGIAVNDLIP